MDDIGNDGDVGDVGDGVSVCLLACLVVCLFG